MDITEAVKIICVKRKITFKELAEKTEQTNQNLWNKMTRNDWKQSEIKKVMDALDVTIDTKLIDNKTGQPII